MLKLESVTRLFQVGGQAVEALGGVDLDVPSGQFLSILGPSGSGKSTLLNVLGCLDRPTSGRYLLEGQDVSRLDDEAASEVRSRRIGFIFQSFHLLPRLTVLENVMLPNRFAREDSAVVAERARKLLSRVGLGHRLAHLPSQLSGGQMQRVAIARALLMRPALVLADEPTGNLDKHSARDILNLIEEMHRDGQTVLMVTHDVDVGARAQRRVYLSDGKITNDDVT
ncbi:ABC transporter ATP-binding protein [Xanthomonas citri]|uniref:ABC transporter ATP-binding protein n=1 Tax=Xanthomonas citri TaxID=346 RepID=UPI0003193883|nr:ABC transporter ATP-binding protein [Xanthomonas citri]